MRRRAATVSALSTLSIALALVPVGAASASASASAPAFAAAFVAAPAAEIQIFTTTIVARGAAVDINYGITCPDGFTGSVTVSVAQVHDGLHASGTAVDQLACTDAGTLNIQRVTAGITGAPFARGPATLAMQAVACDATECFSTPLNSPIRITR